MKSIRSLFLIAIGMMVFTATAHTAKLEQKQKTEFVKDISQVSNDVSVNEVKAVSVVIDATIEKDIKVKSFETKEPASLYTVNKDVGWQSQKGNTTTVTLKEKFPDNYQRHVVYFIDKRKQSIRSNC
jgi:phenylpyruvate tautomerase PptA (4-oxalocrotonate tautomerase family)